MAAPRRARASAPGKVILHGEHAVVFGHAALAASLGLRTTACVQEEAAADAPVVRLQLPAVDVDEAVPLRGVAERVAGAAGAPWSRPHEVRHEALLAAVDAFVEAALRGAAAWGGARRDAVRGALYLLAGVAGDVMGDAVGGAAPARHVRVRVDGALAAGAGCGSSAAFAVALAAALLRFRAGGARGPLDADERRLASAWAFNCERIMHGKPSGVDNAACALGGLVAFRAGAEVRALRAPRLRALLVDTRVRRQTSALAARVAALRGRRAAAVQSVLGACGHVADDAEQILEKLSESEEDMDSLYEQLAELWDMNHCLLAALGVSHPALELVRRAAAAHGLAAKLTGAGGGGCAIVLLPPATADAAVLALSAELRGAGFGVTDALLGGEGVRLHEP